MGEPYYIHIAAKMMGCDPHQFWKLYPDAAAELRGTADLVEAAGGELRSRQVIGFILNCCTSTMPDPPEDDPQSPEPKVK